MRIVHPRLLLLMGLGVLLGAAVAARGEFPLKNGDIWVMAGDSITAQHLHSNYFEAFCYARYPKMKFGFRNSGVGGHTIPSTLARFDYDIAAWKPTIVSVELGMNDKGGTPTEKFIANMETMVERIRGIKARPVIFAASPVNNGETMSTLNGNKRLDEYADALKGFCADQKILYADQFHQLVDLWGKNKPYELLANSMANLKAIARSDEIAGIEQLRAFLAVQEKGGVTPVSMQGDAVHPGAPGQLMMAAALLKELDAESFVSSATVSAAGDVKEAKGCKLTDITSENGTLAFDRLDECLPFPIPEEARAVLPLYPTILDLSQYTLKVTGLKSGRYQLKIEGAPLATLTTKELEAGVNLTAFGPNMQGKLTNPIAAQSKAILAAVSARAGLVGQWRGLSQKAHAAGAAPELMTELADMTRKVLEGDVRIREAAVPQKLHFELSPVQ